MAEPAAPAFATLRYEVADAIATITLDRPEALNALTVASKQELLAAFERVAGDRSVRAVVLTGAGRAFCSGQDLKERLEPDAAPLDVELRERYNPIIRAMRALDRPIVGAINGIAAGAGASLAFACDLRIAAEGASFLLAFGRVGLIPDSGATWLLPRLVGPAKAAEMALLTEPLSAADAERFGLVMRVVPGDQLMDEARAVAVRLAGLAPRAVALTKRALDEAWDDLLRGGARNRGEPPGRSRLDGRPRRGHRGLPREAAASVHRGVANAPGDAGGVGTRRKLQLVADAAVGLDGEDDLAADPAIGFDRKDDLAADPAVGFDGEELGRAGGGQGVGRDERQGNQRKGKGDADRASVKEGGEGHVDGFLVSIQLSVTNGRLFPPTTAHTLARFPRGLDTSHPRRTGCT